MSSFNSLAPKTWSYESERYEHTSFKGEDSKADKVKVDFCKPRVVEKHKRVTFTKSKRMFNAEKLKFSIASTGLHD